jgi:hypothetical protein
VKRCSTCAESRKASVTSLRWNKALVERLLREWELNPEDRVGPLSVGQTQKLAIILALGHEPDLLVLDEPAASLDLVARRQFLTEATTSMAPGGVGLVAAALAERGAARCAQSLGSAGRALTTNRTDHTNRTGGWSVCGLWPRPAQTSVEQKATKVTDLGVERDRWAGGRNTGLTWKSAHAFLRFLPLDSLTSSCIVGSRGCNDPFDYSGAQP